jgi:hypothetical protein
MTMEREVEGLALVWLPVGDRMIHPVAEARRRFVTVVARGTRSPRFYRRRQRSGTVFPGS